MKFDDFKALDGDIFLEYENALTKFVQKFLASCGFKKVDALRVSLKEEPFKDIVIGFMKNRQVFLLEKEAVKDEKLHDTYDSALAEIFAEMETKEIKQMCQKIETNLIQNFVRKSILKKALN